MSSNYFNIEMILGNLGPISDYVMEEAGFDEGFFRGFVDHLEMGLKGYLVSGSQINADDLLMEVEGIAEYCGMSGVGVRGLHLFRRFVQELRIVLLENVEHGGSI